MKIHFKIEYKTVELSENYLEYCGVHNLIIEDIKTNSFNFYRFAPDGIEYIDSDQENCQFWISERDFKEKFISRMPIKIILKNE